MRSGSSDENWVEAGRLQAITLESSNGPSGPRLMLAHPWLTAAKGDVPKGRPTARQADAGRA